MVPGPSVDTLDTGDVSAAPPSFEPWVAAHGAALLRFAYLVLGDADRAEEAVQEGLSRAYRHWDRVSAAADPGAYVRRMIVNADVSWWRRFGRREVVADPAGATRRADPGPDHAAAIAETDAMWRLCETLPRRQRAAVVLRFYERCSDAEIADILGCTPSTVRSQIHRALATLRTRLDAADPEVRDDR